MKLNVLLAVEPFIENLTYSFTNCMFFSFLKEGFESNTSVEVCELASTSVTLGFYEMFFESFF